MTRYFIFTAFLIVGFTARASDLFLDDDITDEPLAGTILKQEEDTTPYAYIDPKQNITDILSSKSETKEEPDIYFTADELIADDKTKTIEATGDVVIKRADLTVYTDRVIYDQNSDTILARGNVELHEKDGVRIFSDEVDLTSKMTRAQMSRIKAIMKDESKLWAEYFYKKENNNKVMRYATYTPCDCCTAGVDNKSPLWRIRARKVTHDAAKKDINYNDAFLDIKNVPVLYTPFFSHPDPTVKRRSGFLPPKIGSSSYLGATLEANYFWDINDQMDILFSPTFSTNKGIVWGGRYRGYTTKGYTQATGTYLRDKEASHTKNRGNLFAFGRYELNDLWLLRTNFNYVSDDLYLKELSLDKNDEAWLTSNISFERFKNRNYAAIEAYYYKLISYDIRRRDRAAFDRMKYNKPLVLPFAQMEYFTEPDSIGSYIKNDFSYASLYHDGGIQSHRASMINTWNLPWTSPYGERYRIVASLKTDAYHIEEYRSSQTSPVYSGNPVRVFPQLGVEWKLPFIKATETTRQILEPVVVGVLAPNGGNEPYKIPNEDSQDLHLEDTNILDLDRYAGYDRNDNGSRISYGFNWSTYGNIMGRTSAFLAQSYQFNKKTSFTESTDTKGHFSDYVGRIYAVPSQYFDLTYRFRLDRQDYQLEYSELTSKIGPSMLNLYISYIYLQNNKNASDALLMRKELYTGIHAALTRDWSINIYNRQDLAHHSESLEHGGSLVYEDECFMFITKVKKYNSNNPNIKDSYEFNFSFLLKTLGGLGS